MRRLMFAMLTVLFPLIPATAEPWLVLDDLQGAIPKAPLLKYDDRHKELCRFDARAPADPTDEALTAAGWLLWDDAEREGNLSLRRVVAGLDGQCRPMGGSAIVFVAGLPFVAYRPANDQANLVFTMEKGTLLINQSYVKPGEALCCGTGKREASVALPK